MNRSVALIVVAMMVVMAMTASANHRVDVKFVAPADTLVIPTDFDDYIECEVDSMFIEAEESQPDMSICGQSVATAEQMCEFARAKNPDFDCAIAEAFLQVGEKYGIRGDVAFCQSIIETGWFMFVGGTAVTPDQHNYCGMGVTERGMKGNSFETIEDGVTAQIQHLYAYCCREPLPADQPVLDPRFKLVRRGCAPLWTDLNNRWAANNMYGQHIMNIYLKMISATDEPENK